MGHAQGSIHYYLPGKFYQMYLIIISMSNKKQRIFVMKPMGYREKTIRNFDLNEQRVEQR